MSKVIRIFAPNYIVKTAQQSGCEALKMNGAHGQDS